MLAQDRVTSTDGARLATYTAGRADGPLVLLVHGWAQSAACWRHQFDDPTLTAELRLVALDLRGHGRSEAPDDGYDQPLTWADDVRAVLEASGGGPAVLVGWSYGALVLADYLSCQGTAAVSGLMLTGGLTGIGRGIAAGRVGPVMRAALPDALRADPAVCGPALTAFVQGLAPQPLPDAASLLEVALATAPRVRQALFERTQDGSGLVEAIRANPVPVLVQHGTADAVVSPATAQHHLSTIPGAIADWWPSAGHVLFMEDPRRFASGLLAFARSCATGAAKRERTTT